MRFVGETQKQSHRERQQHDPKISSRSFHYVLFFARLCKHRGIWVRITIDL
jgi:hypothetical protein